ncbi:MAG: hypothetical protein HY840_01470 [Bacteroidetes bacterium]|nr:hypothetical protein [Bacteroidota bacterium]
MTTIDKALDTIMKLDFYSREMLLDILKKRIIEERRNDIAKNARIGKKEFTKGKYKPLSSEEGIHHLRSL